MDALNSSVFSAYEWTSGVSVDLDEMTRKTHEWKCADKSKDFARLIEELSESKHVTEAIRHVWDAYPLVRIAMAAVVQRIDDTVRRGKSPIRRLRVSDPEVDAEFEDLLAQHLQWRTQDHCVVFAVRDITTMPHVREAMRVMYHRYEPVRPLARIMCGVFTRWFA